MGRKGDKMEAIACYIVITFKLYPCLALLGLLIF